MPITDWFQVSRNQRRAHFFDRKLVRRPGSWLDLPNQVPAFWTWRKKQHPRRGCAWPWMLLAWQDLSCRSHQEPHLDHRRILEPLQLWSSARDLRWNIINRTFRTLLPICSGFIHPCKTCIHLFWSSMEGIFYCNYFWHLKSTFLKTRCVFVKILRAKFIR